MKGWVYVISEKGKPGLVKVGYTTKDPELRARELDGTASPHPHIVDYEVLVEDPYQLEQKSHKALSDKHEGKEWFRTTTENAVYVIRLNAGDSIITEDFKRADKEAVLKKQKYEQQERTKKEAEGAKKRRAVEIADTRQIDTRKRKQKIDELSDRMWAIYSEELQKNTPEIPNFLSVFMFFGLGLFFWLGIGENSNPGAALIVMLLTAVLGLPLWWFYYNKTEKEGQQMEAAYQAYWPSVKKEIRHIESVLKNDVNWESKLPGHKNRAENSLRAALKTISMKIVTGV